MIKVTLIGGPRDGEVVVLNKLSPTIGFLVPGKAKIYPIGAGGIADVNCRSIQYRLRPGPGRALRYYYEGLNFPP